MIEIEKPRIECIENSAEASYGKFIVEPLERGYGTTLGTGDGTIATIHELHYLRERCLE